jgi:hypothetical protein
MLSGTVYILTEIHSGHPRYSPVIQFGPVSAGTSPLVCCEAISETHTGWPVKRVVPLSQLSQLKKRKMSGSIF